MTPPRFFTFAPNKYEVAHLALVGACPTFCHKEQEDLLWIETVMLVPSINPDISIGLCSQLREAKEMINPTQLVPCKRREVIALLLGPAVNPNMLPW